MSRVQVMLVALSLVTLLPGVQGHGAVTKPWPRRGNQPMYCPWCIGEHNSANPYGQPHVNARPGSPCLGTNRGDAHYTGDSMGGFPNGPGPKTYTAGKSFQANIGLSADHGGVAQWTYCPHTESETEECFKRHELTKWKDVHSYWGGDSSCDHCHDGESYPETVTLPNMPSGRITLRWMWVCKWTDELFASCIDVDVVGTGASPTRRRRTTAARRRRTSTTTRRRRTTTTPTRRRRSAGQSDGCCKWGGQCGDCGDDSSGWCHKSASNCQACTGSFDANAQAPVCRASVSQSTFAEEAEEEANTDTEDQDDDEEHEVGEAEQEEVDDEVHDEQDADESSFVQEAVDEEAASEESDDEVLEEAGEEEGEDGDEEAEDMDDEDMEDAIDEEDDITDDQEESLEQVQEDTDDVEELSFVQEEAEEDQDNDDEHEAAEEEQEEQDAEEPSMMQEEVDDEVRDEQESDESSFVQEDVEEEAASEESDDEVVHRERNRGFLK